jgi:hypothetical protein
LTEPEEIFNNEVNQKGIELIKVHRSNDLKRLKNA